VQLAEQPGPAGGHGQRVAQPHARTAARHECNGPPQRLHAGPGTGMTRGQTLNLLHERASPASGCVAEEPPDLQLHHHSAPADGILGEPSPVTAVHPTRGSRAARAPQLRYGAVGFGHNDPAHLGQPVQHHPHGVREQCVLQRGQIPHAQGIPAVKHGTSPT
jgi:hypothetical protein